MVNDHLILEEDMFDEFCKMTCDHSENHEDYGNWLVWPAAILSFGLTLLISGQWVFRSHPTNNREVSIAARRYIFSRGPPIIEYLNDVNRLADSDR